MPNFFRCPKCSQQLRIPDDAGGKRFKCPCGTVSTIPPPTEVVEDVATSEAEEDQSPPQRRGASRKASAQSGHGTRTLLMGLLVAYFPFLACVALIGGGVAAWLIIYGVQGKLFGTVAFILGSILGLSVLHLLWGLRVLFMRPKEKDDFEFELPEKWQGGLVSLVDRVAEERGLPVPDAIRVHATDVAKVYEDQRGQSVLVLGGVAIAAFSQKTLGGIIAHELGHTHGGDTSLSRRAHRWHLVMTQIEYGFWRRWWNRFNPLTWPVRAYHFLYALVWFANSRQEEYAADRHEVALVGKQEAGAALLLVTLLHETSYTELGALADAMVETNERIDRIFVEQVRRVQATTQSEWEGLLKKALRRPTGWFDTHPALGDRLKGIGTSPKKALKAMMTMLTAPAEPSTALFTNWPVVEKFLTDRILTLMREIHAARAEYNAIVQAIARQM